MTNGVQGLLSGGLNNPLLNIGAGLLSVAGPSDRPRTIGEGLAKGLQMAQTAQGAALQNQLVREQMLERKQRKEAVAKLQGILSPGGEKGKMLGILSEISPQQVAQTLLGQTFPKERSEPADIRALRAVGVEPTSPEGRKIILERLAGKNAPDEILKQVQLQIQAMQLEDMRSKRAEAAESKRKAKTQLGISINSDLKKARELAELNDRLEGTFLESGLPAPDLRRMTSGLLASTLEGRGKAGSIKEAVGAFDRFQKLSTDFMLNSLERFEGTGTVTNAKLQAAKQSLADIGTSPQANRLVIADMMEMLLNASKVEGIETPERDNMLQLIGTLRGERKPAAKKNPKTRVINFDELPG